MPFTPQGYESQTPEEIIADINAIFITVFGINVNTDPSSPNGQFINELANWAINNQNFILTIVNLYNPNIASTVWLDAICAFSGIKRLAASSSYATCLCTGSAGTIIPSGTQISNTAGDVFASSSLSIIGSGGTVQIIFTAINTGEIPVESGTLTNIINKVYGWDSVTNLTNGTVGGSIQSDDSLRSLRSQLLATYGSASLDAIYSAVYNVSGVVDVYAAENDTELPIVIGGVTLVPNSIYIAAIGGTDNDVAAAMYKKKCPGVLMNGNTTVNYVTRWGNTLPITFQRPVDTPVIVRISLQSQPNYPVDFAAQVKQAIVNNFNGVDTNVPSIPAVKIGQVINTSRFVPSLIAIGAWDILTNTIELATGGTPAALIQLDIDKIAILTLTNVIVTIVT